MASPGVVAELDESGLFVPRSDQPAISSRSVTEPGAREPLRPQAGQNWPPSNAQVHQLLEEAARLPRALRDGDPRKRHPFPARMPMELAKFLIEHLIPPSSPCLTKPCAIARHASSDSSEIPPAWSRSSRRSGVPNAGRPARVCWERSRIPEAKPS